MTRDQITAEVKMIFTEQFGEDAAKRLDSEPAPFKPAGEANRFADDLDSLDHVEFIMALEDHFKIEIDDVTAALVKVSPRPICRCCGYALPRTAVEDVHKRCKRHLLSNPCAIAGCSHTRGAKQRRDLHDGSFWLCRDHWRMACPPHSPMRRAYNRFFRTAKKLGIGKNDPWPEQLENRYWRFWMGLVGRARRMAAGDIDMTEINKMFGWDE